MFDNILLNEEKFLRVATFLSRQAQRFNLTPEQMNRMKPTPSELVINTEFSSGGNVSLLDGNTTQQKGVTNIDGNRLENGRFFVIDGVTILYGEAADGTKVWDVNYNKALPAVLISSDFVIRQNGEVIVKLPVAAIENAKKSTEDYYRVLGALAVIEPTQTIEMMIETPVGSSITPDTSGHKSFVRVLLRGFETYVKR